MCVCVCTRACVHLYLFIITWADHATPNFHHFSTSFLLYIFILNISYVSSFLSILFFSSFFFCCLWSIFLHPKKTICRKPLMYYCFLVFRCIGVHKKTICRKPLMYYCFLVFRYIGVYISLDLFTYSRVFEDRCQIAQSLERDDSHVHACIDLKVQQVLL